MATKPSEPTELGPRERDVRASRPYLLSRGTARATVRRVLAVVVLAGLDAVGLALGLYAALVLRASSSATRSSGTCSGRQARRSGCRSSSRSRGSSSGRPGSTPAGSAAPASGGCLVDRARGRDHARVRLGHGLRLHDIGPDPDRMHHVRARDRAAPRGLRVGHPRAAAAAACPAPRFAGRRRRSSRLARAGRSPPRGVCVAYDLVGSFAPGPRRAAGRRGWRELRPDEIVLSEGGFDEETVLELVETAHRGGVRVRHRAEDDGAAAAARRVRAGAGRAAVRAAAARARGHGLGA